MLGVAGSRHGIDQLGQVRSAPGGIKLFFVFEPAGKRKNVYRFLVLIQINHGLKNNFVLGLVKIIRPKNVYDDVNRFGIHHQRAQN